MLLSEQRKWRISIVDDRERVIKGKYGLISQYPDGDLDVWITTNRIALQVERSGWKAEGHYDDGAYFIRPYEDLDKACKWIKARKRRVISPEQKQIMAARLQAYRNQTTKSS